MKLAETVFTLMSVSAALVAAEPEKAFRYNGNGYAFFSAGMCNHRYGNVGAGGGGEGFLWRGLSLGADLGYYDFPGDGSPGYGVLTLGPSYHFVKRNQRRGVDPYLGTGILGIAFHGREVVGMGTFVGGANYWFKDRLGLRTEGQVQVLARSEIVFLFRVGLSFR